MQPHPPVSGPSEQRAGERPVLPPIRAWYTDDTPNFNLSNVQGIPISLPPDQTPLRPHIPHIRMASDPPKMISPQHISSSSASRSSHRLTPTRSLPSYPEHTRPAHPQHDHSLSGDYGRSPARHYLSASSSPYKGQVQLPHPEQIHPRHQERSPYGPQVPPGPNTSPRGSISTSLQPDKFVQTVARYECPYCGKAFNRPSSLKTHTNTHTGEKPFVCPHPGCGRAFSVQSNMRRHARVHDTSRTEGGDSSADDGVEDPPLSH